MDNSWKTEMYAYILAVLPTMRVFLREGKIEEVGDDWRDSVDQFVELQFGLFILFRSFSY